MGGGHVNDMKMDQECALFLFTLIQHLGSPEDPQCSGYYINIYMISIRMQILCKL